MQIGYAMAPLWSIGLGLIAVASVLSGVAAQVLGALGVTWFAVGLVVAYVAPGRLFPGWLKAQIAAGTVHPPRPTGWDWAFFWLVVAMLVVGIGAFAVDLIAFGRSPFGS